MAQKIIDVSRYQGDIDWEKVKTENENIWAIIRIGYRGYGDGSVYADPKADRNIKECIRLGIPYGVYFFSQAVNEAEGRYEAERTLQWLKNYEVQPLLPVFIDTERSGAANNKGRADRISNRDRTAAIIGFCEEVEKAGYWAGVYRSTYWFIGSGARVNDGQLAKYSHWVADYSARCRYTGSKAIWQYSSTGKVSGISGNADMNYRYVDFPTIIKKTGLNGYKVATVEPIDGKDESKENNSNENKEPTDNSKSNSEIFTAEEKSIIVKAIRLIIKRLGVTI